MILWLRTLIVLVLLMGLPGFAWAGSMALSWNANTESDLAGYKVYCAVTSSTSTLDTFNRADNTDLGSSWDPGYSQSAGADTGLQIVGNRVRTTSTTADATETFTAALASDQFAQVTLTTAGAGLMVPRVLLRFNTPGVKSGYEFAIGKNGAGFTSRIGVWNVGTYSTLTSENVTTWGAGDVIKAEAEGSTLRLYRNGVLLLSATNGTLTSGRAGLTIYSATIANVELDDFSAGNIGGFGTAVAQVGTTSYVYNPTVPVTATYTCAVTAYDTSGNESGFSNQVSQVLTENVPPSQPTGVSVQATASPNALQAAWTNGVDAIDSALTASVEACRVVTGASCSNFVLVNTQAVTGGSAASYTYGGLAPNTAYCVRVNNADQSTNQGSYSSPLCAVTAGTTTSQGAVVQCATNLDTASGTTLSVTLPGVTAGNAIVAFGHWAYNTGGIGATSAAFSGSDTWTTPDIASDGVTTAGERASTGYALSVGAGSRTVTMTLNNADLNKRLLVCEISGVVALDQHTAVYQSSPGTGTDGVSTGPVTTSEAPEFIVAFFNNFSGATTATDAFTRANAPTLGANYTAGYSDSNGLNDALSIVGNVARSTTTLADAYETHNTAPPDDQYAELTINNYTPGSAFPGLVMRQGVGSFKAGYECRVGATSSRIAKWSLFTGSFAVLTTNSSDVWQSGDTIRCEVSGTATATINMYKIRAGVQTLVNTYDDSASPHVSGKVGILNYASPVNSVDLDDFEFGPLNPAPGMSAGTGFTVPSNGQTAGVYQMSVEHKTQLSAGPIAGTMTKDSGGTSPGVGSAILTFTTTTSAVPLPTITNAVTDATGSDLTVTGTPVYLRVQTETTNIVYTYASVVAAGRYTQAGGWLQGMNFACFFAQDANHTESSLSADYQCDSLTGLMVTDITAPVLSAPGPSGTLANGIPVTLSITTNEIATVKYGTSDVAYASLPSTMTTVDGLHHSAVIPAPAAGPYTYYTRGRDVTGNINGSSTPITFTVAAPATGDLTRPSSVSGLSCSAFSSSQATCTFTPATDNVAVTGYQAKICPGAGCTPVNIINPTWSTATTQTLTGLTDGLSYSVSVKAFDAAGNLSLNESNIATFTTPALADPIPPSDTTDLREATGESTYQSVSLVWTEATDNVGVVQYDVYRCEGDGCTSFSFKQSTPDAAFIDQSSIKPKTVYRYKLVASDGTNASNFSNIVTVLTPDVPDGITYGQCPCRRLPR